MPVDPELAGKYSWYNVPEDTQVRRLSSEELQLIIDSLPHDTKITDYTNGLRAVDDKPFGPDAFVVCTPVNTNGECVSITVDGDYLETGDEEMHMYHKKDGEWIWTHFLSGTEGYLLETKEEERNSLT